MDKKVVDCVVIGGGPGGYPAAIRLAQNGKKVILIEANQIGGTCLNRGCIPTKAYVSDAHVYHMVKEASQWGVMAKEVSFDWKAMKKRKDDVVQKLRSSLTGIIRSYGIEILQGYASFINPTTVQVVYQENVIAEIEAASFIVATGSECKELLAYPFDSQFIHSSTSLLDIEEVPKSLLVVGGGVIGCEFASIFAEFGTQVHIVEALDRILPMECVNVSKALSKAFKDRGIEITTGVSVQSMKKENGGIQATLASGKSYSYSCALICVGRSLNSSSIGLDKAQVAVEKGAIVVDEHMKTSSSRIWAIGDVTGKTMYAHAATHQGMIAADNILGHPTRMKYEAVPGVIFTTPEIGSVGLSLEEAKKRGFDASLGSYPLQGLGKAQAALQGSGFAQIVVENKTGRILGAQIVGSDAELLIAEMTMAIENELTIECVGETIHAHPTLSEVWMEASFMAQNRPLHFPKK